MITGFPESAAVALPFFFEEPFPFTKTVLTAPLDRFPTGFDAQEEQVSPGFSCFSQSHSPLSPLFFCILD